MSVTRNEMKNEALARMRILKIRENAVNDLEKNDIVTVFGTLISKSSLLKNLKISIIVWFIML